MLPVYNLTVDGQPEFFAGGVLVHNCRVHHVGAFPLLEDELCDWVPGDRSPNRLDALVWAFTELMLDPAANDYASGYAYSAPKSPAAVGSHAGSGYAF